MAIYIEIGGKKETFIPKSLFRDYSLIRGFYLSLMKSPGDKYIFFFRDIKDYVSQKNLSQFTMHTPVTHFCVI